MKSSQHHRILRDNKLPPTTSSIVSAPVKEDESLFLQKHSNLQIAGPLHDRQQHQLMKKLAPIGQRDIISQFPSLRHQSEIVRGSVPGFAVGLPKIADSAGGNDQINQFQKRIKDLEKENYRLNHHIQQAEQTLKNYRDVYGSIPSDPIQTPSPTKKLNKENLTAPEANQINNSARIINLEAQLKECNQRNRELTAENQRLVSQMKETQTQCQHQMDQMKSQQKHLQGLHEKDEQQIYTFQQQISQLKDEISQYKARLSQSSPVKSPVKSSKLPTPLLQQLFASVQALKREYSVLKMSLPRDIMNLKSKTNDSVEYLQNYFSTLLQNTLQTLQQQKAEHIVYKVETERLLQELREKNERFEQRELIATVKSPAKLHNSRHDIALSPIQVPSPESTKSHPLGERSHQEMAKEIQYLQRMSSGYEQKIVESTQAMASLSELHLAEIKSIKHLAHIRELIRVAKEREQAIDKDRMIIEIKQLK